MKKLILTLTLLSSFSAFAFSADLICAISDGEGYIVKKTSDGETKLYSIEKGSVADQRQIDPVEKYNAAELSDKDMALLRYVGINPAEVSYLKSVAISKGEPSVILFNAFNQDDDNLGGALVVPAGLPVRCQKR